MKIILTLNGEERKNFWYALRHDNHITLFELLRRIKIEEIEDLK